MVNQRLAGNRLHPVRSPCRAAPSGRSTRRPSRRRSTSRPLFWLLTLGNCWIGLQHRAGLVVVDDHRPEVLDRDVGRQMQPVVLAAVERIAVGIQRRPRIGRALADDLRVHRRRDAGGEEEVHERSGIEVGHAGLPLELVAAEERAAASCCCRSSKPSFCASPVDDGAGGRVAHGRRLGEDLLHPLVGREGLALLDADRRPEAERGRVERYRSVLPARPGSASPRSGSPPGRPC